MNLGGTIVVALLALSASAVFGISIREFANPAAWLLVAGGVWMTISAFFELLLKSGARGTRFVFELPSVLVFVAFTVVTGSCFAAIAQTLELRSAASKKALAAEIEGRRAAAAQAEEEQQAARARAGEELRARAQKLEGPLIGANVSSLQSAFGERLVERGKKHFEIDGFASSAVYLVTSSNRAQGIYAVVRDRTASALDVRDLEMIVRELVGADRFDAGAFRRAGFGLASTNTLVAGHRTTLGWDGSRLVEISIGAFEP